MNICISIGHGKSAKGGYDSGALGGNYQEFKIAREIGRYIGEAFKGYACTADVINYDATLYLTDRIAHVNKHGYDLAIEIHLNASGGTGSEVYYKHKSATGKKLAAAISKSIANTFGIRDRGAKVKINPANGTDYFGFVRSCKCESLLIETVFIDTASDRKHVETAAGQRQCAEALEYAELYPLWSGYVDYAVGSIVRRPSGLYKCYNAIAANPTWLPENTAAHWEPITVGEDGTIDNPITAAAGMRYFKDKYYLDGGKIYRCTRDDSNGQGTILHYVPSQLVGIYFEELS